MQRQTPSTLISGCDALSAKLKLCLSPMGLLFQFGESRRPKPLSAPEALLILASLLLSSLLSSISVARELTSDLSHLMGARQSVFVSLMLRITATYRLAKHLAIYLIALLQHSTLANVIAAKASLVSLEEQSSIARSAFAVHLFKAAARSLAFWPVVRISRTQWEVAMALWLSFFVNVTISAPTMFACYMGACLGCHVENFSRLHVDTMFDQFERLAAEAGSRHKHKHHNKNLEQQQKHEQQQNSKEPARFFKLFSSVKKLNKLFQRLNERKYPELPEMKMAKLSSTQSIQVSEQMCQANARLIRLRLKKSQVMLSELRDVVSDINKMSSPVVMIEIIYDTLLIILITTSSIQAKLYRTPSLMILPTVANVVCLSLNVYFFCTCLDRVTSELKLMVNKLFDFIIMNHRVVQSSSSCKHISESGPDEKEDESEALSETWSQFQYTRKLANTIQFTMAGILPISRRLILNILGHILSAVFISIEIMSIIDTSAPTGAPIDTVALDRHHDTNLTRTYHHH